MRAFVVVLLLVALLLLPSQASLALDPTGSDGGSGRDAGDDASGALPLAEGNTTGALRPVVDQDDFYAFDAKAGDLAFLSVAGVTGSLQTPEGAVYRTLDFPATFPVILPESGRWLLDATGCGAYPARASCPYLIQFRLEAASTSAVIRPQGPGWTLAQLNVSQPADVWFSMDESGSLVAGAPQESVSIVQVDGVWANGEPIHGFGALGDGDTGVGTVTLDGAGLHEAPSSTPLVTGGSGWYVDSLHLRNGTVRLMTLSTSAGASLASLHVATSVPLGLASGGDLVQWRASDPGRNETWLAAASGGGERERSVRFAAPWSGLFLTDDQFGSMRGPDGASDDLAPGDSYRYVVDGAAGAWGFAVQEQQQAPAYDVVYLLAAPVPTLAVG